MERYLDGLGTAGIFSIPPPLLSSPPEIRWKPALVSGKDRSFTGR
ncbi:hypothetical protein CbuK_1236 [Coxiella burnetii CbuK_Q154]|nr:hypothetical protein CbuK_1236 [Coxiella burnetii CbuK_Q154]